MGAFIDQFGTYTAASGDQIATYQFSYFPSMAVAACIIFLGLFFVKHSAFLRKAALPAPVISGLLFSICISAIKINAHLEISFDVKIIKDMAQNLFFGGVGFAFSVAMLKKAGKKLVFMIALGAVVIITLEDAAGLIAAHFVGLNPLLALQCASASMAGGVATAAAMGPFYESLGAANATVVGIACGTCGNILASLVGGPIGVALIKRHGLKSDPNDRPKINKDHVVPVDTRQFLKALCLLCLLAFVAEPITWLFKLININMPVCISCIFGGAIVRSICDIREIPLPLHEIDVLSNNWLQFYLALIMMTVDFTKLAPLAGQILILLITEIVVIVLFGYFIAFRMYGSDYGAAVMVAGNLGWCIGSATNAVANEEAVMTEYGWHTVAWDLYPSWSVICDDLYNPAILSILGNILA